MIIDKKFDFPWLYSAKRKPFFYEGYFFFILLNILLEVALIIQ